MTGATIDSLRSVQNDNYSLMAEWFLPKMLAVADFPNEQVKSLLEKWNFMNDPDLVAPSVFETWHNTMMKMIWDDEFPEAERMTYPTDDRTLTLIEEDPESVYFDNINTKDKKETFADIATLSLEKTLDSLSKNFGDMSNWNWSKVKNTGIRHLVPAFEAFSVLNIDMGGGKTIVNATQEKWGPSWRMVVQLDKDWPVAHGLYPGGQSGNPASKFYANMVPAWSNGELYLLIYLKSKEENHQQIIKTFKIDPKS
jgi:penicillin amidase